MKFHHFLLLLGTALLFTQCKKENNQPPVDTVDFNCSDQPTVCELTAANGDFAIEVFKQINSEEPSDKNIFISPFSMSTALTMTTNGAAAQTLEKMRNTLKINNLQMASVNDSYKTLIATLPNLDANTKLMLANSIWPQEDYPVLPSFLETNSTYFSSEVVPVDFKQSDVVVGKVNQWVSDKTNGLIPQTLDQLSPETVMLLINAIYFKGAWKTIFKEEDTHTADFSAPSGTVQVDMMHLAENDFPYFENALFQAVDLPYGDSIFSMTVLLPKENQNADDIISAMTPTTYNQWLGALQTQAVELFLPKFKLEYEVKMKRALSDMGMEVAFTDQADFHNMIDHNGIQIDDVIHKAVVEVNEKGTEAAAVTVVQIIDTSVHINPVVNVNKPFVFVIRDNKTNSILFMGKVMNPTI
jgi:serpin B